MEAVIRSSEAIGRERFALHLAGVPYETWARMTRWQIVDFIARHEMRTRKEMQRARKGLSDILGVVLGRILGV